MTCDKAVLDVHLNRSVRVRRERGTRREGREVERDIAVVEKEVEVVVL